MKFGLLNVVCLISPGSSEEGKRHVSSKTVIITLLVCVVLTTTAFLVTTVYYIRRKDALSPRSQIYSFDKYTSWSSRSNLVSHRSSPLPQLKPKPRLRVLKGMLTYLFSLPAIWVFYLIDCLKIDTLFLFSSYACRVSM